jgi:probable phosphoglycerate mutase
MTEPTLIHLIRHGAHDLLGHVLAGIAPGIHLNAEGRRQAQEIAVALAQGRFRAVIATPLERTQETAAALAAQLGLAVRVAPELTDIDFGIWTMVPFDELDRDPRWHEFNRRRSLAAIPGGETMIAVQARAVRAIRRLADEFTGAEIAVFGHSDVIKLIVIYFLGMSLDAIHQIEISPGGRSVLSFDDNGVTLRALNLPSSAPAQP